MLSKEEQLIRCVIEKFMCSYFQTEEDMAIALGINKDEMNKDASMEVLTAIVREQQIV